jgi:hypothetical protein
LLRSNVESSLTKLGDSGLCVTLFLSDPPAMTIQSAGIAD